MGWTSSWLTQTGFSTSRERGVRHNVHQPYNWSDGTRVPDYYVLCQREGSQDMVSEQRHHRFLTGMQLQRIG
jgi:hypothetical protein